MDFLNTNQDRTETQYLSKSFNEEMIEMVNKEQKKIDDDEYDDKEIDKVEKELLKTLLINQGLYGKEIPSGFNEKINQRINELQEKEEEGLEPEEYEKYKILEEKWKNKTEQYKKLLMAFGYTVVDEEEE